jgi:hypothetical protein
VRTELTATSEVSDGNGDSEAKRGSHEFVSRGMEQRTGFTRRDRGGCRGGDVVGDGATTDSSMTPDPDPERQLGPEGQSGNAGQTEEGPSSTAVPKRQGLSWWPRAGN